MNRALLALAGLTAAISAITGCASELEGPAPKTGRVAQPEVVAIDVFDAEEITATCSGTLLAENVVLTAAHCVAAGTNAFVHAPDAGGQTAAVKLVRFYDWALDGQADHAAQHDLALLVLDAKIELKAYPTVRAAKADGLSAIQAKRTSGLALDAVVSRSKTLKISKGRPTGKPNFLFLAKGAADAGGGLFTTDKKGARSLVGVMVGRGKSTKGYYAARLEDGGVQSWISAVLSNPTRPGKDAVLAKLRGFDDGGFGGYEGGGFEGGGFEGGDEGGYEAGGYEGGGYEAGDYEGGDNGGGYEQPSGGNEPSPEPSNEPSSEPSQSSEPSADEKGTTDEGGDKAPAVEEPVQPSGNATESPESPVDQLKKQEELGKAGSEYGVLQDMQKQHDDAKSGMEAAEAAGMK